MLTYNKIKRKKQPNQNIFDYILTNYGSLKYLNTYFTDNSIDDIQDFYSLDVGTTQVIDTEIDNLVLSYYSNNNILVASIEPDLDINEYDFSFDLSFSS